MKNKIFKYYILTIIAVSLFSCETDDDFLKETPKTFYTVDNAITAPAQINQVLLACYQQCRELNANSESREVRVLAGSGTDVMDVPPFRNQFAFSDYTQINPLNNDINTIYSAFYQLISKANTALYGANSEEVSWSSEENKKYAIAQAKFFRAYGYRNLGELFGGVPLVDQIITTPKFDFERSTRIETYRFAIDDLESALPDLPATTAQAGRVVKAAAQHYLSELYLALGIELEDQGADGTEMFNKAVQYASAVIDGGTYELMTERYGTRKDNDSGDVFWDLFQIGNQNFQDGNTECIWAYQMDFDAHIGGDDGAALWHARNYTDQKQNINGYKKIITETGDPRGIGRACPTAFVIFDIWKDEFGYDIRNSEANIQRTFVYNDANSPKFGETFSIHDYLDLEPGTIYPTWSKVTTPKWLNPGQGFPNSRLFRDDYAIRLSETILLRAEAYWRIGQNQKAADDINTIRLRAQCQYLIAPGDVTLDFILDERARELFFEEKRWNTLLRMGGTVAVDRIRTHNYWPNPNIQQTLNFDFNLWPIPQQVIDRNKDYYSKIHLSIDL